MRKIISIFAVAALLLTLGGGSFAQDENVKARDQNAQTALMRAALAGNAGRVEAQIAAGADVRAKDKNGETALMMAALAGNADIVKALIAAGADVKAKDRKGQTALTKAAGISSHSDVVKLLLDAGANGEARKGGNASNISARSQNKRADDSVMSQVERDGALITPPVLRDGEGLTTPPVGGLIAYSLKAAQAHVLAGSGGEWRRDNPELFTLAGITRPEGVVVDRASGDIILVGHAEGGDAPLTLDDFVVALRARMIQDKWPSVSIDPFPGKPMREGDPQTVHFEGGIQDTQFGADLLDADHRLKRMTFGVLPTGVAGLSSSFERKAARYFGSDDTAKDEQFGGRGWFEPVQDRVIVRDDVVQLGPMTISVFAEVSSVGLGGNTLGPKSYRDEDSDAFARDLSSGFDDVARAHPTVARLRGLNGIVADVAGLARIDNKPSLEYWLHQYTVRTVKTLPTVKVLRRTEQGRNRSFSVQGGVELQAIVVDLQSGDVSAMRRAVLAARPQPMAVSWRLIIGEWVIPLSPNALPPSAIGPLYAQAAFLSSQERWDDVIALLNAVLCAVPDDLIEPQSRGATGQAVGKSELSLGGCPAVSGAAQESRTYLSAAYNVRAIAYGHKGQYERQVQDYDQAIRLDAGNVDAFYNRATARKQQGQYDLAIQDCDQAIRLSPNFAEAYGNRGVVYADKHQYDRAIQDYDEAIRLNPNSIMAHYDRAHAYNNKGQYDRAIQDYGEAIRLNPSFAEAFTNRAIAYGNKGEYDRGIEDFNEAIRLDPNPPMVYFNRGTAYYKKGEYDRAVEDFDQAIRLDPNLVLAYFNRGIVYVVRGQHDQAIKDYDQVIRLDPNDAGVYALRGSAYGAKRQFGRAIEDYDQAIRLNPKLAEAYLSRGLTFRALSQEPAATADFAKARQLNPSLPQPPSVPVQPSAAAVTSEKAPTLLEAIAGPTTPAVAPTAHDQTLPLHSSGPTADDKSALMKAAYSGDLLQIKALIAANADVVNAEADDGRTALDLASLQGHLDVVQALIAAKADVNARTATGISALIAAATQDRLKIVQTLITAKADVNAKTDDGITALYLADGDLEMVQALIAAKADVNARTATGQTALMQAALENHLEVVQALIAANADVNIENTKGLTALILAERMGYEGVVQFLKKAGAVGK